MKVCVVGLGSIGLPTAELCAQKGHETTGLDINQKVVEAINQGKHPKTKQKLAALFRAATEETVLEGKDVILVCVPTESDKDNALEALLDVIKVVAKNASKGTLVVVESTIPPGTMDKMVIPTFATHSKLVADRDVFFAHCPERLDMGNPNWNAENLPRILGANSKESQAKALAFYTSILTGKVHAVSSLKAAEITKVVENAYREINVAYVNELAKICEKNGIDMLEIIQGAATKPVGYMPFYPGCGVGGTCIPAATEFVLRWGKDDGFPLQLVQTAKQINRSMPAYTVEIMQKAAREEGIEKDLKVGILGMAYKPGIDDVRQSPALEIERILNDKKIAYKIFDPYVHTAINSLSELLGWANCIVLVTSHPEFKGIEKDIPKTVRIVIDGRNFLSKELIMQKGIRYRGIGR